MASPGLDAVLERVANVERSVSTQEAICEERFPTLRDEMKFWRRAMTGVVFLLVCNLASNAVLLRQGQIIRGALDRDKLSAYPEAQYGVCDGAETTQRRKLTMARKPQKTYPNPDKDCLTKADASVNTGGKAPLSAIDGRRVLPSTLPK